MNHLFKTAGKATLRVNAGFNTNNLTSTRLYTQNIKDFNNKLYPVFSPNANVEYNFYGDFSLNGSASIGRTIKEADNMAHGYIMNNYRTFTSYNSLSKNLSQYYNLSVKYTSILSLISANIYTSYSKSNYNLTSSTNYDGDFAFLQYVKSPSFSETFRVGTVASKSFGINTAKIFADVSISKDNNMQLVQETEYKFSTRGILLISGFSLSPWSWIELSYRFNYSFSKVLLNEGRHVNNTVHNTEMNLYPYKNIKLKADYTHYSQKQSLKTVIPVNLNFLNAKIDWSLTDRVSFTLTLNNLLNTKKYKNTTYDGVYTNSSMVKLRGREILLGISIK